MQYRKSETKKKKNRIWIDRMEQREGHRVASRIAVKMKSFIKENVNSPTEVLVVVIVVIVATYCTILL